MPVVIERGSEILTYLIALRIPSVAGHMPVLGHVGDVNECGHRRNGLIHIGIESINSLIRVQADRRV